MTQSRRDFHRWEPWMSYFVTGLCLALCVAFFATGQVIVGLMLGAAAVFAWLAARV